MTCGRPTPVLLYHGISTSPSPAMAPYTITPNEFEAHMEMVVASGRRPVTASALATGLGSGFPEDENLVAVTFDDGFRSYVDNALPVLTHLRIASSVFVTSGWLADADVTTRARGPRELMLSSQDLAGLADIGVEIGAHSHTHPQMDTLGADESRREILDSRRILEDAVGGEVTTFAYPHGYQSSRVRRQVRTAGFTCAFGVRNMLTAPGDNMYNLARQMVMADTPRARVEAWLAGSGASVAGPGERTRTRAHRLVRRGRAILTGRPGTVWG